MCDFFIIFFGLLGLFFNKAADSCDFARNVICKKKSTTTTSTTSTTTPRTTTRATTTLRSSLSRVASTTTPFPPPLQDYEDDSEEDPQTIKQLIHLIKKLGQSPINKYNRGN